MKKIISKIKNIHAAVSARTKALFASSKGESYVDTAVKILIAVVIGALVLAGLYLFFNTIIMPTLNERIQEMFSYRG